MYPFNGKGSCKKYCAIQGLTCVSAYDAWGCNRQTQRTCDFNRTDDSNAICECGTPTNSFSPSVEPTGSPDGKLVTGSLYPKAGSYNYIGCYQDGGWRAMSTSLNWQLTVKACADAAKENNLNFFGLQNYGAGYRECYGSNDLVASTHYGTSSNCVKVNESNVLYTNGLGWANAIYSLTPVTTVAVAKPDDMNTKSCATMLLYKNGPYNPGAKICPRYAVNAGLDVDSCTAQPYANGVTCRTFCKSFPGLTCLDGAGLYIFFIIIIILIINLKSEQLLGVMVV